MFVYCNSPSCCFAFYLWFCSVYSASQFWLFYLRPLLCHKYCILFFFLFVCSNQMGFFLFMLCCIFLYISFHILLSFFHILFVFSLHGLSPHLVREATCTMQLKSIGNCYICLLSGWVSIVNKWWRLQTHLIKVCLLQSASVFLYSVVLLAQRKHI